MTSDVIAGGYPLTPINEVAYLPVYDEEGNLVSDNLQEAGFNDASSASWLWGVDITLDYSLDLVSWWGQVDMTTYSYASAGDPKVISQDLYDAIPEGDVRKKQFVQLDTNDENELVGNYYPINKFYHEGREIGGQRQITTDYLYMRVAEMYLLHAEAAFMNGNEAAARQDLKTLLAQRYEDAAGYAYVDGLSGQSLLDEIYLQTRIELWGEGKSYLAMKRLGRTVTLPSNHGSFSGRSYEYNSDELTFEIP